MFEFACIGLNLFKLIGKIPRYNIISCDTVTYHAIFEVIEYMPPIYLEKLHYSIVSYDTTNLSHEIDNCAC